MRRGIDCGRARRALSLRIDGRLDIPGHRALDDHLRKCGDCRAVHRDWGELGALARAIPAPGLSDRARRRVLKSGAQAVARSAAWRPRSAWLRTSLPAARMAAAMLLSASIGLLAGHALARRDAAHPTTDGASPALRLEASTAPLMDRDEGDAVAHDVPEGDTPPAAPIDAVRFARGARALLEDLSRIDRVPEPLREPLVRGQIRMLGLDEASRRWIASADRRDPALDSVATLVDRLDREHGRPPLSLARDEANRLLPMLEAPSPPSRPPSRPRPSVESCLDEVAPDLDPRSRGSLGTFLLLRESWVDGREDVVREFGERLHSLSASSVTDSGDPLFSLVSEVVAQSVGASAPSPEAVERRVERIEFDGGYEIQVEEVFPHGRSTVVIRRSHR